MKILKLEIGYGVLLIPIEAPLATEFLKMLNQIKWQSEFALTNTDPEKFSWERIISWVNHDIKATIEEFDEENTPWFPNQEAADKEEERRVAVRKDTQTELEGESKAAEAGLDDDNPI